MNSGIKNKRWFCQKVYSIGVGRTYGGDIDNFYFGYHGDRLIIWEAKHRNAKRDYDSPQAHFLKRLVNNLINLEVLLVWVEHDSSDDIIYLKDTTPVMCYYKGKGETSGCLKPIKQGTVPQDITNWADRR